MSRPLPVPRGFRRVAALVSVALLAALGLAVPPAAASTTVPWSGSLGEAIARLATATEDRTGYDRTLFRHWIDADRDCQNARQEVLIAETLAPVTFTTTGNCTVATGRWYSFYDGLTETLASAIDIDHMVPLAEAWDSGASRWTPERREAFANDLDDPRSLIAVTDNSNASKGDQDPAEWLPTFERCRYVADWTATKLRWLLAVDTAERTALVGLAAGCGAVTIAVEIVPDGVADLTAPTAPGGLTATATSATTASLQWTPSTDNVGVTGYRVSRNGTTIATVTTPGFSDTGLSATTTYSYAVVALDAAGNVSSAASASVTTPQAPLVLSGTARRVGSDKFADLSWTGGGTRFDLWRSSTRVLSNTTLRSHTQLVGRSTTSATYTVCPAGTPRTSTTCSSVTIRW
jgi:hypothetical protein